MQKCLLDEEFSFASVCVDCMNEEDSLMVYLFSVIPSVLPLMLRFPMFTVQEYGQGLAL